MFGKMDTQVVLVTPELAEQYLLAHVKNRPLRRKHVDDIAAAITRGEWIPSHLGVAFDTRGHLIDGRHRLHAIIKAGIPVALNVSFNCAPESYKIIDTNLRRQMSDIIGRSTAYAASLRLFHQLDTNSWSGHNITATQIEETSVWAAPLLDRVFDASNSMRRGLTSAATIVGVAIRAAISSDPDEVCKAYRDYVLMNFDEMAPAVQTLIRQITAKKISSREAGKVVLVKSFRAFDPAREVSSITVKDIDSQITGLSEIVRKLKARALKTPLSVATAPSKPTKTAPLQGDLHV